MSLNKVFGILLFLLSVPSYADSKQHKLIELTKEIAMVQGPGGNVAVVVGQDYNLLIDDKMADSVTELVKVVQTWTSKPTKFVVNTHWHFDHTGGNDHFGKSGSVVVAHENVRKRMNSDQFIKALGAKVKKSPPTALPVVTFQEGLKFHIGELELEVEHLPAAHTDGDAVVWIHSAKILHAGDVFFNGKFPFIDQSSGGSVTGVIAAMDSILKRVSKDYRIIPGHGPLGTMEDLKKARQMLRTVYSTVQNLEKKGHSKEAVLAARPAEKFAKKWASAFMPADRFVGILYDFASAQ